VPPSPIHLGPCDLTGPAGARSQSGRRASIVSAPGVHHAERSTGRRTPTGPPYPARLKAVSSDGMRRRTIPVEGAGIDFLDWPKMTPGPKRVFPPPRSSLGSNPGELAVAPFHGAGGRFPGATAEPLPYSAVSEPGAAGKDFDSNPGQNRRSRPHEHGSCEAYERADQTRRDCRKPFEDHVVRVIIGYYCPGFAAFFLRSQVDQKLIRAHLTDPPTHIARVTLMRPTYLTLLEHMDNTILDERNR